MKDVVLLLFAVAIAILIPVSLFVFAVAERDRFPIVCALSMVAVLGLQYCSMKALP